MQFKQPQRDTPFLNELRAEQIIGPQEASLMDERMSAHETASINDGLFAIANEIK